WSKFQWLSGRILQPVVRASFPEAASASACQRLLFRKSRPADTSRHPRRCTKDKTLSTTPGAPGKRPGYSASNKSGQSATGGPQEFPARRAVVAWLGERACYPDSPG